jgi:thymidylate synthase (FAD)
MKVELIDHFGSDKMVVDVARVSYNKEASNYTEKQNNKLIKYLWNHKHTSPFRHLSLQFRIICPIYVERQLF